MGHRRGKSDTEFPKAENPYTLEPYGMYNNNPRTVANGIRKPLRQRERYIDEEEEYGSANRETDVFDADFELVGTRRRTGSPTRGTTGRGSSRRPDVHKFRAKVHAADDTRYIIVGPDIEFVEFEARIREKFGFQLRLRIRMQDDGDMITMVDQEDLDLLIGAARENARREGSEMGKMEVSCLLSGCVSVVLTAVDMGGRTTYDLVMICLELGHTLACFVKPISSWHRDRARSRRPERPLAQDCIPTVAVSYLLLQLDTP